MNITADRTTSYGIRALCLALLALFFGAMTPRPVAAADQVPFSARFTTEFSSSVAFPFATIMVHGDGHALHMGASTAASTDQTVNLITGEGTATYTLTAANGDTLELAIVFATTFDPGGVIFEGTYIVTGGTGRFANATGSGAASGSAIFTSPDGGVGSFSLNGTISRRGR